MYNMQNVCVSLYESKYSIHNSNSFFELFQNDDCELNLLSVHISFLESPICFDIYEPIGETDGMSRTYYVMYIFNEDEDAVLSEWYSIAQMNAVYGGKSLVAQVPSLQHCQINFCALRSKQSRCPKPYSFTIFDQCRI